ncbi:MAG: T9SS type A sorting domain-containing protein [Bacteroidetes bacterium]|nr:T9SS type A sorting domain-containing protein [Bacteroidota bacterium]
MIRKMYIFGMFVSLLGLFQQTQAQTAFTAGNIVIVRVGDGSTSLINTGNPVFLDEYTTTGSLVQSIALPIAVDGTNKRLILSGTATSEGALSRSADGSALVLTGYDAAPGGATSLSGTSAASVNRTVGLIYADGTLNTSTGLTDFASANNPRSATTTNGTDLWMTGGAGGIRYATLGATTSNDLSSATLANVRVVQIFDNQLYFSTASGTTYRVGSVGTGLPTSGLQTLTHLTGIPAATGSPYGYFMADLDGAPGIDVIYVADDGANALRKYSLVAGTWTLNGTIGVDADDYRGITGSVSGTTVTLYCTIKGGSGATGGGQIVTLTDASGYNGAFAGVPTLLFTAAINTSIRGISMAPEATCTPVLWYADADGDNYGDLASTQSSCTMPSGYVADSTDCNDADGAIYPGATELCNSIDDNCDGTTDEEFINPIITFASSELVAGLTGPSSSQSPYLTPLKPGVQFTSIFTAGDVFGDYTASGLMDGIGAYDNGDGTFTVLINHEIGNTLGVVRDHGFIGTFVSKWIINKADLSVVSGGDLMQNAFVWNAITSTYEPATAAFSRFCSSDLPAQTAFYNSASGNGSTEKIFMNGEESGNEGRQFAHIVTGAEAGNSYELAALGKAGWENSVASYYAQDKTVVVELDDNTTNGQVYVYVGTKTNTGLEIEKAGLTNGILYGITVDGMSTESSLSIPAANTAFSLTSLGSVSSLSGATLNTNSITAGVTNFLRPEDGAWDPQNPSIFYFVTTNSFTAPSRLWKLVFTDINNPELGGTITALLDGTEGPKMMDNMTVDNAGNIIIQEDPGNQKYLARIWEYRIATDELIEIAQHDENRFILGAPSYLTQDEESSGVIDISSILGPGMLLLDDQAHYAIPGAVVEGGQLLVMYNPDSETGVYTATDTVRVNTNSACTATGVVLGTPMTSDNCVVASVSNDAPTSYPLGNTTVTWTVTDGSGNSTTGTQVVIVTDEVLPTITAPAAVVVSADSSCTASEVSLGTPITADNCGVASVTNNAPATYPLGATTVTWTVTDVNGNFATVAQTVTVTGTAATYYADVDGDTYGNSSDSIVACVIPSGYVVDNTDCNDSDIAVNPGATEICNGIDDNCDGNIDDNLIIATATPVGSTSFCRGNSVQLDANTGAGYTYQWKKNGNNIPGATAASYTANKPGNYTVLITIPGGCSDLSDGVTVTVLASPAATITNVTGWTDLCTGSPIKLKANGGATLTYQWYRGASMIAGATSNTYNVTLSGNYSVEVTNTVTGCTTKSAKYPITQTCKEGEDVIIESSSFNVYPNPTNGSFTIDMTINASQEATADIMLYNMIGEIVYQSSIEVNNNTIFANVTPDNNLSEGLYIVKVVVGNTIFEKSIAVVK